MSENNDSSVVKDLLNATLGGIGTIVIAYLFALFSIYLIGQSVSFQSPDPLISASLFALEFGIVGISVVSISYLTGAHKYVSWSKPNKNQTKIIGIVIGIMLIIQVLSSILLVVSGIESATNAVVDIGQDSPIFYLYMIPVMLLFVGPVEEYMFRGVIQGSFTENVNRRTGIAVASVLFGLIHISAIGGLSLESIPYIVTATGLGVVLGYYYDKTDNLVVPMVAHGVYNSILMVSTFGFTI